MEPREIAQYMVCAIKSRKQILNLVFGREKDEREKKIEDWIQVEMLARLIELEEDEKDGTPDLIKSECPYPCRKLLFSIPYSAELWAELGNISKEKRLPISLKKELIRGGMNFDDNPKIRPVDREMEWKVTGVTSFSGGERKTCVVIKEGNKFNVRSIQKESCDFWWEVDGEEYWLELKTQIRIRGNRDVDQNEIASDLKKRENLKPTDIFHQLVLVFLKPSDTEEIKKEYTDIYLCNGMSCEELWRKCLGDNRQMLVLFCS